MSLIKNDRYVKITTLDSVPENTSYIIKEYILLNGDIIHPFLFVENPDYTLLQLTLNDTIVIKGSFYNYNGNLLNSLDTNSNANMCIVKENEKVKWYLGSGLTPFCEIDAESGVHLYGFHEGLPFYDNELLSPDSQNYTETSSDTTCNLEHLIRGYRIYRIIISVSKSNKTYSYYPCSDGTNVKVYEALSEGSFCYLTFSNAIVSNKNVKYGVSIDDVKSAIGSRYRDLMAMMAEDSGNIYTINQVSPDNAYKIIEGGVEHRFAFALKDVSIPSEATTPNGQLSNYKKGELIYGHRPKWNIWANSMPYSVWNRPETDYNGSYDTSKKVYATYNLTEHWGKDGKVRLEWFKDYSEGDIDKPEVSFINPDGSLATNIEIHYHNGVPCICTENDILPSLCTDRENVATMFNHTLVADRSIYRYNNILPKSSVTMKLGNLINWNTSLKDLFNADTYIDTTGTPYTAATMNQLIYGMVATLTHLFLTAVTKGNGYETKLVDVIIGYATEQTTQSLNSLSSANKLYDFPFVALSSDSDEPTVKKFKEGKIPITENGVTTYEKLNFEKLRATGNEEVRLYNELVASVKITNGVVRHIYKIDAVGSMNLLKRYTEILPTETPRELDLVYLDKFIEPTKLSIEAKFDINNTDKENELNYTGLVELLTKYGNTARTFTLVGKGGATYGNHNPKEELWFEFNETTHQYILSTDDEPNNEKTYYYYDVPTISLIYDNPSKKTRVIFMNENNNDGYSPYLYVENNGDIIPFYFFPIGYRVDDYTPGAVEKHYINESTKGITIPFILTLVDLTSYQKIADKLSEDNMNPLGYKYNSNLNLRVFGEVVYSEDIIENNRVVEKIIKKDRFNNPILSLTLNGDIHNIFKASNYLNLDTSSNNNNTEFLGIRISPENLPHLKKQNESNLLYIPDDVTVKFWLSTENLCPHILYFDESWNYSSINDSWYKCILGESLYIFIKDLQNNTWFGDLFNILVSHWLYGKKRNLFIDSLNNPTTPTGGSYDNEVQIVAEGWTDSITLEERENHRLWMSERFFAKLANYLSGEINSLTYSDSYVNLIEQYLFTDQQWSNPIEIKNDSTNPIKFLVYVNNSSIITTLSEFLNYLKYIEGEGFHGLKIGDNIVALNSVSYDLRNNSYKIDNILTYYDGNLKITTNDFTGYSIYQVTLNSDLSIASVQFFSETSLNFVLSYCNLMSDYLKELIINYGANGLYCNYYAYVKYMFSKTSTNSPSKEPRSWVTLDELLQSGELSSEYKYMYFERYIFDIFGMCYKVFNIIQIKEEAETDNFYPILNKQKLDRLLGYKSMSTNWYKIEYDNNSYVIINKYRCPRELCEVLAPYKIDGLNIDITNIVCTQFNISVANILEKKVYLDIITLQQESYQDKTIQQVYVDDYEDQNKQSELLSYLNVN